jgi:DNA-binding SARP family transcriptional activator
MLHIRLLGDFLLLSDDSPVTTVSTPRLKSLFAYLVLHSSAPQSRNQIAFLLWPDTTEAQAQTNLRNLVFQLRRALPNADLYMYTDSRTLGWRSDSPFTLDVAAFEKALIEVDKAAGRGEPQDSKASIGLLQKAVDLYRGDLLPLCYDEWILPERERLSQSFVEAAGRLILLLEAQRDYGAAIKYAQRLLRHDPLRETTYRDLMRLYALTGDRAAALYTYHTCATILQRELTVEPSRATREAYEQLLHTERAGHELGGGSDRPPYSHVLAAAYPLVGRQREWARLQGEWRTTVSGEPHAVLLVGEAGIGKTRLGEELVEWAERQGIAVAVARCYAAEGGLAFAPVVSWLRTLPLPPLQPLWRSEIARLLPELLAEQPDLPEPGPLTEAWQRQRLLEALVRALLGSQPLLLMIDDLQWCDRDTLEFLHYLLRYDPGARLMLIGTMRPEEIGAEHPLASLLAALRRNGQLAEIELGLLGEAETVYLASKVADRRLDASFMAYLYKETEGNPLFVVEAVRADMSPDLVSQEREEGAELTEVEGEGSLRDSGAKSEPTSSPIAGLSPTVYSVIATRLERLSPACRELVSVAATVGREFTFDILARASGVDEATLVQGLDELWQRRIVREQGTNAYDFSHDKLRGVAYASLSQARRRVLHRRVAEALEAVHTGNLGAVSGQIAAHYERASMPSKAAAYHRRAAEAARRVYANEEAMSHLRRGLTLLQDGSSTETGSEAHARFHEDLADVLELIGRHPEARVEYWAAIARIPGDQPLWRSRLLRKVGLTWSHQFFTAEALDAYDEAEAVLGMSAVGPRGRRTKGPGVESLAESEELQEWTQIQLCRLEAHYFAGSVFEMSALLESVRPVIETHGTLSQRIDFYGSLVQFNLRRNLYVISEETMGYCRAGLEAAQRTGDPDLVSYWQFMMGFGLLWHGDLDEAEESLLRALEQAERSGNARLQTQCLNYLAIVYRRRGRIEETRQCSERTLAGALEAQVPWYGAFAKANLAWVAWRRGELDEAREKGQIALDEWEQLQGQHAFNWLAVWPLIGVLRTQGGMAEAITYARALFGPTQQPLPDALAAATQAAIRAWERGRPNVAITYLDKAIRLALEDGYL